MCVMFLSLWLFMFFLGKSCLLLALLFSSMSKVRLGTASSIRNSTYVHETVGFTSNAKKDQLEIRHLRNTSFDQLILFHFEKTEIN